MSPEREAVLKLHQSGMTVRQIAKRLDISTQRVYVQFYNLGIKTGRRP